MTDLLPRLKDQGYDAERVARRRAWVEQKTGAALQHIGASRSIPKSCGATSRTRSAWRRFRWASPAPCSCTAQHAQGLFYVPMATSEGALIRSYERGMVALTRAGGVQTALLADENQIAPTFFFKDVAAAAAFCEWAPGAARRNAASCRRVHHAPRQADGRALLPDRPAGAGQLRFSTGDAQGMNMIVKATDAVCQWIEATTPISSYFRLQRHVLGEAGDAVSC